MNNLCIVGVQLREIAVAADKDFKSSLAEFFSEREQGDERRRRLEALGVEQRETHKYQIPITKYELTNYRSLHTAHPTSSRKFVSQPRHGHDQLRLSGIFL